jgi:hypothetical protein
MSATVFQFGSAASTNPTGISNDFKFSFTFNSLTTATSNATSCFPFQPPSFQQQKPIMLKQQQSLFLPQQQQQQQQQSAGIFRLNPYKDSVTQEQPTGRKTTVFKDKHFTADQNKENIDPKTGAQPSAATKEKNVKRTRFGMSSGPLVDITTGYLNNSAPPEAPYRQVTSQFVGLGWGGEVSVLFKSVFELNTCMFYRRLRRIRRNRRI